MPNHFHSIIAFRNTGRSINKIIGNGKRFMAYEIIDRLKKSENYEMLARLASEVDMSMRARGKLHEVWEDSFDWKECRSRLFLKQKLDYLHNNPFVGKWSDDMSSAHVDHSSRRFYESGEQGIYPVTHYLQLEDIDLSDESYCR